MAHREVPVACVPADGDAARSYRCFSERRQPVMTGSMAPAERDAGWAARVAGAGVRIDLWDTDLEDHEFVLLGATILRAARQGTLSDADLYPLLVRLWNGRLPTAWPAGAPMVARRCATALAAQAACELEGATCAPDRSFAEGGMRSCRRRTAPHGQCASLGPRRSLGRGRGLGDAQRWWLLAAGVRAACAAGAPRRGGCSDLVDARLVAGTSRVRGSGVGRMVSAGRQRLERCRCRGDDRARATWSACA